VSDTGKASAVQAGEKKTGIAVTEPRLAPCSGTEALDCPFGNPVRSVASARKPDCINGRVISHLEKGLEALAVGPCKVVVDEIALRMEDDFKIGMAPRRKCDDSLLDLAPVLEARAGCDYRYAHLVTPPPCELPDWHRNRHPWAMSAHLGFIAIELVSLSNKAAS
jgi:hypothetical protein